MNGHLHPVMRDALNAHLLAPDDEPEPGFWRCACGTDVPETWVYCYGCGKPHPHTDGVPGDEP